MTRDVVMVRNGVVAAGLCLLLASCRQGPSHQEERAGDAGEKTAAAPASDEERLLRWRSSYEDGKAKLESGDLEGARERLLCATLIEPRSEAAAEALRETEILLRESLLKRGRQLLDRGSLRSACPLLARAAGLGASREASGLLEKYGYKEYLGAWVHKDDIASREKMEERRAKRRRAELELPESFVLDRQGDVRIFTDHPSGEILLFTRRLHSHLDAFRRAYERLFVPLGGGRGSSEGIDVVIFRRREDYEERTGSKRTLGMFMPRWKASFFFLGDRPSGESFSVLLHEACHQLDDAVLGMRYPPPWLQEGLATCFEDGGAAASLSPDYTRRVREAAAAVSSDAGRWWGIRRIVETTDLSALHGTEAVHDFYAQAAFVVRFLLEGRDSGRTLFYLLVQKAREPDATPRNAWRDFELALGLHGETPESFDADLLRAAAGQ